MPTYEYRCPEGYEFELFQSMSAEPVATCPCCGKASQRLLSGGAGLLFKGEGFYITDYRSAEYKEKAKADSGGGSSASSSGGSSGSTKDGGSGSSGGSSGASSSSGSGSSSASSSD